MKWFYAVIIAALITACYGDEPPACIVRDGKPAAEIVVAPERPRMVTLAALDLQYFIRKLSGARLPIVTEPGTNLPVKIYVGRSAFTGKLGVKADDLKYGAYRIASGAGWMALVGDDRDFVPPFQPFPTSRKDQEPCIAAWKKMIEGKTDAGWIFPFLGAGKRYWSPADFDKILEARYEEGSAALWKTGGNAINGFWEQDESGSLNAVHEFLRGLGVRLYMPGAENEIIPGMASIPLQAVNKTSVPDYAFRNWMWYGYSGFSFDDVLWARRIGMNSTDQLTGLLKGPHGLVHVHGGEECKKNHPEYFALFAGGRDLNYRGHGTPCFNSEGFDKETVNYIRFIFDSMNLPSVDIWPGDGLKHCQCEKCKGMTSSEMVWGFANRMATEIYKTHPDKMITCGAYTSYIDAPDTIGKFSPNLAVWIANSGRPRMMDPDHWSEYWARVQKWQGKLAPGNILRLENNRYHIWGTMEDAAGKRTRGAPLAYPVIHPRAVARDLKALKGISRGDTGEQNQYGGKWKVPAIEHITLYVQARFLWDASLNVDEVLNEYCDKFYGPAAKQMKAAIDFAEANLALKDESRGRGRGDPRNVPLKTALKLRDLLDAARATAGDTIYGQRVQAVINDLQPREDVIARYKKEGAELAEARAKAPVAKAVQGSDLSTATVYNLKGMSSGDASLAETSFKAGWDKNTIIFDITCKEPEMKKLNVSDDVNSGDHVAVFLETPNHSYYHIAVNPAGAIAEGNPGQGWKSLADVKTWREADSWRVQLMIPVVGDKEAEADPNHRVAGARPAAEAPWYFNVCRQRVCGGQQAELQAFSPAKLGWHAPEHFGRLEIK